MDNSIITAIQGTQSTKVVWSEEESNSLEEVMNAALLDPTCVKNGRLQWWAIMARAKAAEIKRSQPAIAQKWKSMVAKRTVLANIAAREVAIPNKTGEAGACIAKRTVAVLKEPAEINEEEPVDLEDLALLASEIIATEERGDTEERDVTEEMGIESYRSVFDHYLKFSSNDFVRPKLFLIKPSDKEKEIISRLVQGHMKGDYSIEKRWCRLNASLYAAIRAVTSRRSEGKSLGKVDGHKKWLDGKNRELKEVRQWIGRAETEKLIRERNSIRSAKQTKNLAMLDRYRRIHARAQDLSGFIDMMKRRLQILKGTVEARCDQVERGGRRRNAGSTPGFKVLGGKTRCQVGLKEATKYWSSIAKNNGRCLKKDHPIITGWKTALAKEGLNETVLTMTMIRDYISKISPWKAPGPDGIFGGYWKLDWISRYLANLIMETLESGSEVPSWLSKGRTVLIPKDGDLGNPANYRPITCLNTCYKVLTGSIAAWLDERTRNTLARPTEQRALVKGDWNTTTALLLDSAMLLDTRAQQDREIQTAWIDYAKAYDSLPHSIILSILDALKLPPGMNTVLRQLMSNWRTYIDGGRRKGREYRITRGVFQGDSLSPLLFVVSISPLSWHLNKGPKCGAYTTVAREAGLNFNHQLYMDDLKLYAHSEKDLKRLFKSTEAATRALGMNINAKKTAATISITTKEGEAVKGIDGGSSYRYLGIRQSLTNSKSDTMKELTEKTLNKSKAIFKSDLTIRQKVRMFNMIVIPAARYIFQNGIFTGRLDSELKAAKDLDKQVRGILTKEKVRFSKSNISRLYIGADKGGVGLKSFETELKVTILMREVYIEKHEQVKPCKALFEVLCKRGKRNPLSDGRKVKSASRIDSEYEGDSWTFHQQVCGNLKRGASVIRSTMEKLAEGDWLAAWKNSAYSKKLEANRDICQRLSSLWIQKGKISNVNFRNGLAIQEGQILTKTHPANKDVNKQCRQCGSAPESISHILTSCPKWRTNWCINRHDAVLRNIYYVLSKKAGIRAPHYSERVPNVQKAKGFELWWNQPVQTINPIKHNRPDIVFIDYGRKRAQVIEVAVSDPNNVTMQRDLKRTRYQLNSVDKIDHLNYKAAIKGPNLVDEIRLTYGYETSFYPIIVGTGGEVLQGLDAELMELTGSGKDSVLDLIERIERSAVLGSSRIVKNHLSG